MKIKYQNGYFHGFQPDGEPCFVDESQAFIFGTKQAALLQVTHDFDQWEMDGGNFELIK